MEDIPRDFVIRFGRVIRRYRQVKGLSQEKLADLSGLHRTYISDIERGLKTVSILSLLKIAKALDVPAHQIMRDTEQLSDGHE